MRGTPYLDIGLSKSSRTPFPPGGPLDASPSGLRGLRSWVLDKEHLRDTRITLLALADELYGNGPLLASLRYGLVERRGGCTSFVCYVSALDIPLDSSTTPWEEVLYPDVFHNAGRQP